MGTSIWDYPSLITKGPPTWRVRNGAESEDATDRGVGRRGGGSPESPTVDDIRFRVSESGLVEVIQETEDGESVRLTFPLDEAPTFFRRLREALRDLSVAH
jgi:hypothetical protein